MFLGFWLVTKSIPCLQGPVKKAQVIDTMFYYKSFFSHLPNFLNIAPVRIYSSGHKKKLLVFIFVRKLPNLVGAIFKKTMEDKRNSLLLVASV
jgi:hypothetical protein